MGQREEQKLKANPPLGQQWGRDASHPFCRTAAPHQHSTAWIWGAEPHNQTRGRGLCGWERGPGWAPGFGAAWGCVRSAEPCLEQEPWGRGRTGGDAPTVRPRVQKSTPPPQLLPAAAQSQCVVQKPNTKPPAPRFPPKEATQNLPARPEKPDNEAKREKRTAMGG